MIAGQHVADKKIILAIAIDISEIHSHGKAAGVAQGQLSQRVKTATPIIDPNAIWSAEVIAHIKIGRPIPVNVPEHYGKSPIVKISLKGLAVFIEERAAGKADGLEASPTVVEKEGMGFAMFHNFASNQGNAPHDVRIGSRTVSVELQDGLSVDAIETHARAGPVADRPGPVVGHVKVK